MRSIAMEDVFENEPVPSDPDGQPKHFNGSSAKNVSLRILSMPSSPLPPVAGVIPSSPSAISLSSTNAKDMRHRTSKDRVSRKSRVSTISPGGSSGMIAGDSFPSTVATIDEGLNDGGNSPTTASLAPCSNTTVVKKSKVDFVRFDSTEIHYTENEEVRKKISDEIKSATSMVHGAIHQVTEIGNMYKIQKVTDSTLRFALQSIYHKAWNVYKLDLSGNLLSRINAADFQPFTRLELLNLSSNVLQETLDLQLLQNLKTVDLTNNFLKKVFLGPSIEALHAMDNSISTVHCIDNGYSRKSKRIYLAINKIESLKDLDESCLRNVEYLDLKLNYIDTVDFAELANSVDSLKYLYLDFNFIFEIKNTRNVVFKHLDTLDLSTNSLAFMGPEFTAASNARMINLSENKLVLIEKTLKFSKSLHTFNLLRNGFHCDTLNNIFNTNRHLKNIAKQTVRDVTGQDRETCKHTSHSGPFCCENLPAPFADRLIDLKRKEYALFSGQSSIEERAECEEKNRARQNKVKAMKDQFGTQIDAETRRNREKIQLGQRQKEIEEQLSGVKDTYLELQKELFNTASQLNVTVDQDLPQLLRSIVQKYEDLHVEEQNKQSNAILDYEMYQQMETSHLEENARLKKLNEDADASLKKANATLQSFIVQQEALAKILSNTTSIQQNV